MKARIPKINMFGGVTNFYTSSEEWEQFLKKHTANHLDNIYTDNVHETKFRKDVGERIEKEDPELFEEALKIMFEEYRKIPMDKRGFRSSFGEMAYAYNSDLCVLCLKNGHVHIDRPLTIVNSEGAEMYYAGLTVILLDNKVYDAENDYFGVPIEEYFSKLKKLNPLLRLDTTLTYGMTFCEEETALCAELRGNKELTDSVEAIYDKNGKRLVPLKTATYRSPFA